MNGRKQRENPHLGYDRDQYFELGSDIDDPDDPDYNADQDIDEVVISSECESSDNNEVIESDLENARNREKSKTRAPIRNAFLVLKEASVSASCSTNSALNSATLQPAASASKKAQKRPRSMLQTHPTPTSTALNSTSPTLTQPTTTSSPNSSNVIEFEFPSNWQFLKGYFQCVGSHPTVKGHSYDGRCLKPGCNKTLSADKSSTTNFKRHYQKIHNEIIINVNGDSDNPIGQKRLSRKETQMTLRETLAPINSQTQMTKLVSNAIYKNYHPFSMANESEFIKLIQSCLKSDVTNKEIIVPDRRDVVQQMEQDYGEHEIFLKSTFKQIEFVAVTADVWKAGHEAFLGMTVHWIDDDLKRRWSILTLRRMEFQITYLELGTAIHEVLKKYDILHKTVMVTTDNGSNFIKSFKVYGDNDINCQPMNTTGKEEFPESEYAFIEIFPILENGTIDSDIILPPHHRCASHTLNLLMQTDAEKYNDSTAKKTLTPDGMQTEICPGVYTPAKERAFKLCRTIWTTQNKTTKSADVVKRILGKYLPVPNDTRWNSFYDALKEFIDEKNIEKIKQIGQKFSCIFEERDFVFLREYCEIMKPCAVTLDLLQGEHKAYFGVFLPSIYYLKAKFDECKNSPYQYCAGFVTFLSESLQRRFEHYWLKEEYLIASGLHPNFKSFSKWIRNNDSLALAENAVKNLIDSCQKHTDQPKKSKSSECLYSSDMQRFFDFSNEGSVVDINCGYQRFLADRVSISVLHSYPCLKKFFIQYNTAVPSSAAVERIFNKAGDILGKKGHNITDAHFEQRLKLKVGVQ